MHIVLYLVQLDLITDVSKYLFHQYDWKHLNTKTGASRWFKQIVLRATPKMLTNQLHYLQYIKYIK